MPRTGRHHMPTAFNDRVSREYHKLKAAHPNVDHRTLFGQASHAASMNKTGSGLYMNPGRGLYLTPHRGTGIRRHRIGYY